MVFCEDSATVLTLSKHPQDGIEFDQAKMLNDCLPYTPNVWVGLFVAAF